MISENNRLITIKKSDEKKSESKVNPDSRLIKYELDYIIKIEKALTQAS